MSNKFNKITVITPSYNQGEFIAATIDSVLSQEGKFQLEYLIYDGGSTDNSVTVIKQAVKKIRSRSKSLWPKITIYWQSENDGGQVAALNRGFKRAQGDIMVWLNSDDIFFGNQVLKNALEYFNTFPHTDVLTGNGYLINKKGDITSEIKYLQANLLECLYLDYPVLQPATFVTRAIYRQEQLSLEYENCFDAEYFIRLMKQKKVFAKTIEHFACFRLYQETKTLSASYRRYRESLKLAKQYDNNQLYYYSSMVYRYFEIYLMNRLNAFIIIRIIKKILSKVVYRIILKRWQRE